MRRFLKYDFPKAGLMGLTVAYWFGFLFVMPGLSNQKAEPFLFITGVYLMALAILLFMRTYIPEK